MPDLKILLVLIAIGASAPSPAQATVITGHVRDAASGAALSGASVYAYGGDFSENTATDANGDYRLDLPSADPAADGVNFEALYPSYAAQLERLAPGSTVLDFALQRGGTIAGNVHTSDGPTKLPLVDDTIWIMQAATLNTVTIASTDTRGRYQTMTLPPGDYVVCDLDFIDDYLNKCYGGDALPLGPLQGPFTPVHVSADQATDHIDFSLRRGATVRAILHDTLAGAPITSGIAIDIYAPNGTRLDQYSGPTDGANLLSHVPGVFELPGLAPGDYYFAAGDDYAYFAPNVFYTKRVYGGGECLLTCEFTNATLVHVPDSGTVDLPFDLFPGSVIRGRITDGASGQPLAGVTIEAGQPCYGNSSCTTSRTTSDANGEYTLAHLFRDPAYVATRDATGYIDQVWPNTPCAPARDCLSGAAGSAVNVSSADQIVDHVDFALGRGAYFSGRVTDAGSGAGVGGASVGIYAGPMPQDLVQVVTTDGDGYYTSDGWVPGTYYVAAWKDDACALYGGAPCRGGDAPLQLNLGGALTIAAPAATLHDHVDFALVVDRIFAAGFE